MKLQRNLCAGIAAAALALLSACGGGGGGGSSSSGTLNVSLTDAPACGFDHVNVTVQKVRVNQSSTASDTDAGWSDITLSPPLRVDLLSLSNGVLATLGQTPLQVGHYTQMRLVLAANDSNSPLANSVVPTGGTETALTTPSGVQTGIKMNADITIAADQMADFVIDFNACKSVVAAGSGKFLLKPVVSVTPNFISGVNGYVDSTLANSNTLVTVQQGGAVVKATTPDSTGKFLLEPVAPGTYDLVITAPGRASEVVTGVTVTASTVTLLNASTAPLTLAASTTGTANGTVSVAGATTIDAEVRALQTLANGDKVEIADQDVDATTGAYSFALPAGATMVAAFVGPQGALTFSADAGAPGVYGLEADSGSADKTAGPITLTAGGTVTTNFAF